MIRILGIAALIVLVMLAAAGAAVVLAPGTVLRAGLRAAGVEAVAFDDVRLGRDALEIDGLELGTPADHRLARLRIGYELGDLLRGRIATVEIDGLELTGRLTDQGLELAGFARSTDAGEEFSVPLPWPERIALRRATATLATPWGELWLPVEAELEPTAGEARFSLAVAGARLRGAAGGLNADLALAGRMPLARPPRLEDVAADGHLELVAEALAVPEFASGISGHAAVELGARDGTLSLAIDDLLLKLASLAPHLSFLAESLRPPLGLRTQEGGEPFRIVARIARDDVTLDLFGRLALATGSGAGATADLRAGFAIGPGPTLHRLAAQGALTIAGLELGRIMLREGRIDFGGEGAPGHWQGDVDLALTADGTPVPGLSVTAATLRQPLALKLAGGQLTVAAPADGTLVAAGLAWDGSRTGAIRARLLAADRPLASADMTPDGLGRWEQTLTVAAEPFDLSLDGTTARRARVAPGTLRLELSGDGSGLAAGRASLEDGGVDLPDTQVRLEGIRTEVALAGEGLAPDQAIPVTIAAIRHGADPPWFAPLELRGTLRPDAARVAFEGRLGRPAEDVILVIRGEHDLTRRRGRATLRLAPLAFAPGGRQPAQIVPVLGRHLREVSGRIALDGSVVWGRGDEIPADLALLVEDLGFTAGPARVEGINGLIAFDRVSPLTTLPGQQLAIGLLDIGLPLTSGLVAFELQPGPRLAVSRLRWRFAGGTVSAQPFSVGSETSDIRVTLTADRLDLGQLFALTRLEGLSGEGRIRGTLPVRISGAEAVIDGGELHAEGPGWLRYRPDEVPAGLQAGGQGVDLLLQALENFRYEALRITLDGRTDAAMDIGLHLSGANPDLYGGHPVEFNLNLEGELANILRSGLASYQIPERIRERMQGFGRR